MKNQHFEDTEIFVGIDNGVTGSIGIVRKRFSNFIPIRTFKERNYTKEKQFITRIDVASLIRLIEDLINTGELTVAIERPMVNPARFKATTSALRSLEAVMIALDLRGQPYSFIDSKEWQKGLLPEGTKGTENLKFQSLKKGRNLFPHLEEKIVKHKDADGLLIAEWIRRKDANKKK